MIFTSIVHPGATAIRHPQRGLSLIELMIALTIGMLIMAALGALLLNITRNNSELAKANAQIENGRFAIQVLQNDLIHAGFWGDLRPAVPAAIPDPCLAVAGWNAASNANMLGVPVLGYGSGTVPALCTTVSGAQANSDVLVVRHANTCIAGSTGCDGGTGDQYLQVSRCSTSAPPEASYVIGADYTNATTFPLRNKDCGATIADRRKIVSNIYFISNNTLMRSAFVNGAHQTAQPLVDGIEALRFEYGIDSTGDGSPDSYLSSAPTTLLQLANIVAVKVHVLARNLEATPGYVDSKSYQLGATSYTVPTADVGFKRHVFSTTVRLVNPSGRREMP
ncbi:MAG: PilW family protein [Thiobacillus sp.]|nr:PilW family protein [Thiobacillus sp.]